MPVRVLSQAKSLGSSPYSHNCTEAIGQQKPQKFMLSMLYILLGEHVRVQLTNENMILFSRFSQYVDHLPQIVRCNRGFSWDDWGRLDNLHWRSVLRTQI
jgi:hypothetical protein